MTLTLRLDGTVVKTLGGSGPVGVVRDLDWDGTTDTGTPAPAGTYSWTLRADAKDGDGSLTDLEGTGATTGTVVLTR